MTGGAEPPQKRLSNRNFRTFGRDSASTMGTPMNASTLAGPARPTLRIRGTEYPILLPTVRDPRLHLACVIISLQVLGQTAFGFQLSIAQILVSLADVRADRVRDHLSPPTGDHVAGERAPDGQRRRVHPARAGHAARGLVEPQRLVDLRRDGRGLDPLEARDPDPRAPHLQPVELRPRALLRAARPDAADPLAFWWGPMSPWMVLALAIILVGAFAILSGCTCSRSPSPSGSRSPSESR